MRWLSQTALILALALAGCNRVPQAGATTIPHPDKNGAEVEFFVKQPAGRGPWPTLVFLHGYQPPHASIGGRAYVDWGVLDRFAKQGYLAVSVSLPGFGESSGPKDLAGPFTQHAVEAVISRLEAQHQATPDKIVIEGVSLGAMTGALIAVHNPKISGLVLISGLYDLPPFLANPKSAAALEIKYSAAWQTGGSDEALRSRSALLQASHIKAATLILNGALDDRTDPGQARRLAAAIKANGVRAEVHIYPNFGHQIPVEARDAEIDSFIDSILKR